MENKDLDEFHEEATSESSNTSDTAQTAPCDFSESERSVKARTANKDTLTFLHDAIIVITGVLLVFMLLFKVIVVQGPSMKRTFMNGDVVLLLNNVLFNDYDQGDVVVFSKSNFKNGQPVIKRVIATEGQMVDIDFDAGVVYVDGIKLDEPYVNTPTTLREGLVFPIRVNKDCIFVMGDNRNESKDSRSPEIGQVDTREVMGKALFLAFPGKEADTNERKFDRIGVISHG